MSESLSDQDAEMTEFQKAYLKAFREYFVGEVSAKNLGHLFLLARDRLKNEFEATLDRLQELKIPPAKASRKARRARRLLQGFFQQNLTDKQKASVFPILYGSITYDDPKNLDYDLLIFTDKHDEESRWKLTLDLEENINSLWKENEIGKDGHVSYLSLEQLRKVCHDLNLSRINGYDQAEDLWNMAGDASIILSGDIISTSPSQEMVEKFESHKKEAKSLVESTPDMMAMVTHELKETLVIRETRRAGYK